jgi:hypothetical protein
MFIVPHQKKRGRAQVLTKYKQFLLIYKTPTVLLIQSKRGRAQVLTKYKQFLLIYKTPGFSLKGWHILESIKYILVKGFMTMKPGPS